MNDAETIDRLSEIVRSQADLIRDQAYALRQLGALDECNCNHTEILDELEG